MKKFTKELIFLILQIFMFYIYPLFAGPTDAMAMVIIILFVTLILSCVMGAVSKNKIKYLWPAAVSVLFIPSNFIYYNSSAAVHAIWYLVDSLLGLLLGVLIRFSRTVR